MVVRMVDNANGIDLVQLAEVMELELMAAVPHNLTDFGFRCHRKHHVIFGRLYQDSEVLRLNCVLESHVNDDYCFVGVDLDDDHDANVVMSEQTIAAMNAHYMIASADVAYYMLLNVHDVMVSPGVKS